LKSYEECADILKAVAHPIRLEIIMRLDEEDGCNVSKIQNNLGIPQSTISQHLKILKNANILSSKRKGTTVCYKVINQELLDVISLIKAI